jgi:deoxyribodipyrimidine photolyase-related protein
MVTGLFALLFGVDPVEVHKWYLAIYWDAVEWVEMPNTTGMSQFADGGLMGSKPYAASGKYINRMSNYCEGCRYRPDESVGENACPLTTLYWDFLLRHENLLRGNGRMLMQVRNLARLDAEKKHAIRQRADQIRKNLPKGSYLE